MLTYLIIVGLVTLAILLIGGFADNHTSTEVHNNARPVELGDHDGSGGDERTNYNLNGYNY